MLISKWTGKKVKELKLKGYEDSIDEMWMKLIIFDLKLFTVCDTLNIHGAENIVKNEKSRQMCFELCSSSEWVVRSVAGCIEKLKKLKKH